MALQSSASGISSRILELKNSLHRLIDAAAKKPQDGVLITRNDVGDQLDRFLLWAGDLNAIGSPELQSSFDQRLSSAPGLREQILRQLLDIEKGAKDLQAILDGGCLNRRIEPDPASSQGSHGSGDELAATSGEDDEAHMLLEIISQSITMLFKIANIVREAGPRDRFTEALQKSETVPAASDIKYVMYSHPKLPDNGLEHVAVRLGRAMAKRRQFIDYCRGQDRGKEVSNQLYLQSGRSQSRKSLKQQHGSGGGSAEAPIESNPPPAMQIHADDMDRDNSSLRTTLSTATSTFAVLNMSNLSELAKASAQNLPVKCPVCLTSQSFREEEAWRAHVFSDLKAYLCTIGDDACKDLLFGDVDSWFNHELEHHRCHYECIVCDSGQEFDVEELHSHARDMHDFLDSKQTKSLGELGRRAPASFTPDECPFCNKWADELRAEHEASQESEEEWYLVPPNRFKEHVAKHQEELAIFATSHQEQGRHTDALTSGKTAFILRKDGTAASLPEDGSRDDNATLTQPDDVLLQAPEDQQETWILDPSLDKKDPEYEIDERYPIYYFDFINENIEEVDRLRSVLIKSKGYSTTFIHHSNGRLGFLVSSAADPDFPTVIGSLSEFRPQPWPDKLRPRFPLFSMESIRGLLGEACIHGDSGYFSWAWKHHLWLYPDRRLDEILWKQSSMLFIAVESRKPDMVQVCIDLGADPNALRNGESPWASANIETRERAGPSKDKDPLAPSLKSSKDDTALHLAAEAGHLAIVQILIVAGALVDPKARQGKTPLWLAASNKHMEVFEFLVSLDADPEAADLTGMTPWAAMFASE